MNKQQFVLPQQWLKTQYRPCITAIGLAICMCFMSVQATAHSSSPSLSPAEAANTARQVTGGKVLKVKATPKGGTDYRIKILLPKGQVRHITVDGKNGKWKSKQ